MTDKERVDLRCINTIRTLRFLRFDPDDPIWPNRDQFVLSMGHANMLLYSPLHLTGVKAVNAQY